MSAVLAVLLVLALWEAVAMRRTRRLLLAHIAQLEGQLAGTLDQLEELQEELR